MPLDAEESGKTIERSAPELLRIWRLARVSARPQVFPGLLDNVMERFFGMVGGLLATGAPPEQAWSRLSGVVRCAPRLGSRELTGEWAIAMEVLSAACESFGAAPEVAEWLARAVAEAERGTTALAANPAGPRPEGIAVVVVHGEMQAPRRFSGEEDEG